MEVTTKITKYC